MTQANQTMESVLRNASRIALFGVSSRPDMASYAVAKYLQSQCYELVPINAHDDNILGFPTVKNLEQIQKPVDAMAVFVESPLPASFNREVERLGVQAIWVQPGASPEVENACRTTDAAVFGDQCIMRDHKRLLAHADA